MVRDSFINGLTSTSVRRRLLENRKLDLRTAFDQASALEMEHRHPQAYEKDSGVQVMSVSPGLSNKASLQHGQSTHDSLATINKPCFFCEGKTLHLRKNCPARNSICFKCQKNRHFARCCKSNCFLVEDMASTSSLKQQFCAIQPAPSCLSHATISSFFNGYELSTVIDSGSSLSFVNDKTVKALKLHVESCKTNVALASSNLKEEILGRCVVDIVIENETYQQASVRIVKKFYTDLLLGSDFQSQHKGVAFQYNGSRADLFEPKINHLNVMSGLGIKPGMWKRKRWKRYFLCGSGSGSAKNPPFSLPHGRKEWRKKRNWFCYPS